MRTKIFQFLIGCLLITSCSEDFLTKDNDKGRYTPDGFYNTKGHAIQALNAAYSGLNQWANGYVWQLGIMHFVLGDEFYQTGYAAGFGTWGPTSDFNIANTAGEVSDTWNGYYTNILLANNAINVMPGAQEAADDPTFTPEVLNLYMGQAYFLRAWNYYWLYDYFPKDRIIVRTSVPKSQAEFAMAPSSSAETFAFIEADLKKAQELLVNGLNNTAGYEAGRVTRGAATALLGKLYINAHMYAQAAAEFRKILPGIGDAAYGSYSLMPNYRDNFNRAGENNNESVFEIQFTNMNGSGGWSNNDVNWVMQNLSLNRTSWGSMWWNFAIPNFKLNEYENWTENIAGVNTTVYDYRVYATLWGVPNGATFTNAGNVMDWQAQGWANETVAGLTGVYGMRKYSVDNTADALTGGASGWFDINFRMIRLADIMLLYAECLANTGDNPGALYWVDQVRNRANNVAVDQAHLYSTRAGAPGQLPSAADLMAAKGWTVMQVIEHERAVEGFIEGWRHEDLKRWEKGANYVQYKAGWTGYQSLILPVPQDELDRNTSMPR